MEAILFMIIVAAVSIAGVGLGLALAPRVARWDERHGRAEGDCSADGGGDDID